MIIRCIDFETTGIPSDADPQAIVEIGWSDLTDGFVTEPLSVLCNPGRQIPHEAMAVHHITDAMVANATGAVSCLGSPDYFAAHNADYERKFFPTDIPMICTWKVALRIWPDAPSHSLQFLRYYLSFHKGDYSPLAEPPHRAGPDAYLCAILLKRIMAEGTAPDLETMVRWSSGHALLPTCPLFKHKGKKWADVPTDYLDWIVNKPNDVGADVKANAKLHLKDRAA